MSTLTFLSPAPLQTVQVNATTITSDSHGLAIGVVSGSDMAKTLHALGWALITALPAVDPRIAGAPWNNGGTITISAG
jgi:hypothetical protein